MVVRDPNGDGAEGREGKGKEQVRVLSYVCVNIEAVKEEYKQNSCCC